MYSRLKWNTLLLSQDDLRISVVPCGGLRSTSRTPRFAFIDGTIRLALRSMLFGLLNTSHFPTEWKVLGPLFGSLATVLYRLYKQCPCHSCSAFPRRHRQRAYYIT